MFTLRANIQIVRADGSGTYTFAAVHDVHIKKSIHEYFDTATFSIPASSRLKLESSNPLRQQLLLPDTYSNVSTAAQFFEGDQVTIQLGYDDNLVTEFEGFISKVNFTRPCVVECEGYAWLLRNVDKLVTKSWTSTSLVSVLNYILQTTGAERKIKLSTDMQDTVFGPFRLIQKTGAECLEELKKAGFTVYFIGDTLYAGLEQLAQLDGAVTYSLGWNTIKDDQLKYRDKSEVKVNVEVNYKDKSGKVHTTVVGPSGGVTKHLNLGRELDMKMLETKARTYAHKYRHAGYEGRITGFLLPYAQHGWKVTIQDDQYADRAGDYIIVSTEVTYNENGGRRLVEIGESLTVPESWD